jgi:hypothetical protein
MPRVKVKRREAEDRLMHQSRQREPKAAKLARASPSAMSEKERRSPLERTAP